MFSRDYFSNRFKCLRLAHFLSSSQCAYFLNFKSKGSIANLESGNFSPLVDNLVDIANLFAVSLDWLVGRTNTPYTLESMQATEDYVWTTISQNINSDVVQLSDYIKMPDDYRQSTNREKYPLPIRANILFLVSIIFIISEEEDAARKEPIAYLKRINKAFTHPFADLVKHLMHDDNPQILFDIEKQPIKQRIYGVLQP